MMHTLETAEKKKEKNGTDKRYSHQASKGFCCNSALFTSMRLTAVSRVIAWSISEQELLKKIHFRLTSDIN